MTLQILVLCIAASCGDESGSDQGSICFKAAVDGVEPKFIKNSYIVAFKNENTAMKSSPQALDRGAMSFLEENFNRSSDIKTLRHIMRVSLAPRTKELLPFEWLFTENPDSAEALLAHVEFQDDEASKRTLAAWEATGDIWFYEKDFAYDLADTRLSQDGASSESWWRTRIDLTAAQQIVQESLAGATSFGAPVIAILDSGVDIEHPRLKSAIFQNPATGRTRCGDDRNGCDTTRAERGDLGKPGVHPFGTTGHGVPCPPASEASEEVSRNCGHGTHVAGIAAGQPSVADSFVGVCPMCKILPIKIIKNVEGKPLAPNSAILNALHYLSYFNRRTNIRIVNSSFGTYTRSRAAALAVNNLASSDQQILVIGASGNEDSMQRVFPAAFDDAIAVSAVGQDGSKAAYSNFGPWVDVAAPGGTANAISSNEGVLSTEPGNRLGLKAGTSMATPVVSGIAGLVAAINPAISYQALKDILVKSSRRASLYAQAKEADAALRFNQACYNLKPQGSDKSQPLLGVGLVDALNAVRVSQGAGELVEPLVADQRVEKHACGTLTETPQTSRTILLLCLLAPALSSICQRRRAR